MNNEPKKTKVELMLEEFNRRRDAGEFDQPPTWQDLEGLEPGTLKYGLMRAQIDPEYDALLRKKFRETKHSSRAIDYRARHNLPVSY